MGTKISQLPSKAALAGAEQIEINDAGTSRKATAQGFADLANAALPIVTISAAAAAHAMQPANVGKMHRFTGTGGKRLDITATDGYSAGEVFHACNRAASGNVTITIAGGTLNAPKGGSLTLEPGDTVSIHWISTTAADVFGSTL